MPKRCQRCSARIANHNRSGLCEPCAARCTCQVCREINVDQQLHGTCEKCNQVLRLITSLRQAYHFPRPPAAELEALVKRYTARAALGLDLFTEGAA